MGAFTKGGVIMHIAEQEDWADDSEIWKGEIQGESRGSGISVIFNYQQEAGGGPRPHQHPYPETFIIISDVALFTVAVNPSG
jgi:hypothetical protein